MSTEITNNIDVSLDTTEVTQDNTKDIVNTNQHEVSLQQAEATVEGYKKEYSIVGDGLYASVTATETPQWLAALIDNVVTNAIASGMTDYDLLVQDVRNAIDSIDVAKNTYVEQINVDAIVNGIVATHLDTLNATYEANFATKSELSTVIATTESAIAQNISDLSVSFADDLTSQVTNIQTAYAAADKVLAGNIDALSATFIDQEANVSATADAVSGLRTYVGLGAIGEPDGTGILSSIAILQKQNDGIIEFTIDTYDVMIGVEDPNNDTSNDQLDITKEPYASWVAADTASGTEEVRASHIGDVYIQYVDDVNGTRTYLRSYKFIKTAVDTSSPYSTDSKGYTWALVTDTDAQSAYVAALNAQDLADSKRRVFTNTPYPPYDIGDLWVTDNGSGGAVLKRCSTAKVINTSYSYGDWTTVATDDYSVSVLSTGLSNGTVAVDLSSATIDGTTALTTYISNEIDKEVVVYSGSNHTTQTGMKTNDIYIEKTTTTSSSGVVVDVVNTYKYNGTSWVAIGNNSNITALADLADGKRTVFSGTAVPTGAVERDLWIPEADVGGTGTVEAPQYVQGEIYQYDGINWIATTKYTEDLNTFAVAVDGYISSLTSQIDQKIEYYFQASTATTPYNTTGFPTGSFAVADRPARDGDVLYFTDTKKSYFYSSSTNTWNLIQDQDAIDAIADAAAAQGAADGKISQFYAWGGASAPADYNVTIDGVVTTIRAANFKYWYKTDGKLYYKPSTTWIVVPTTSNTSGVTFVASGDLLSVFNPTTRDTTNYSYNGTSWQINGPDGIISKSKYFVDLDAAVADNASAQADFEIAVKSYTKTSTGEVLSGMSAYQLGWTTDKTIPYGESDAAPIGSCQTLTYRDAVAFAQERGLRLPTLEEVVSGIGAGSGCGFDSAYIWTCTPGLTPGTYYTVRGSYSDPSQIIERDITLTAPCRFVADSHDKVEGASLYAQTKLEYNAPVTVNGITQNAGFGLVNSLSDVTGAPSSGSEFWIDAQKFKFTNSNQTGATSPFTIDASGTNPQITFNGRVSFNSVTSVPDYALDSDAQIYASTAQSNAINTASADATAKANAAKSNAISTAASDATAKANAAQSNAISTASNDATSKANTAQANAELALSKQTWAYSGIWNVDVNDDTGVSFEFSKIPTEYRPYMRLAFLARDAEGGITVFVNNNALTPNPSAGNEVTTWFVSDIPDSYLNTTSDNTIRFANLIASSDDGATIYEVKLLIDQEAMAIDNVSWTDINGRPTSLAALDSTASTKLGGIAEGADVTDYVAINANIQSLANAKAREYWAACYDSSSVSNITYDTEKQAVRLYSSGDSSIGMCTPAQVKGDATSFKITVTFRSNTTATSGVYFRVQEYDTAVLPSGKTHISHGATSSESRVQEATRQVTTLYENLGVTTSWQTKTFTYTPTSTAQNFSFLVLNWTGLGANSLYIRDISIVPQAPDISNKLPQTINSTSIPTASNVYPAGSIWRYSHSVTINGVASTEYTHYLSQGNGVWQNIGGTYIDGSKIVTGSINASNIAANTITGDRLEAGTELRAPVINGAEVNIGEGGPYDGYHTKITPEGVIYTDHLVASGGTLDNMTVKGTLDGCTGTFTGDITGASGTFSGTVSAEKVIGDIVSGKAVNSGQTYVVAASTKDRLVTCTRVVGNRVTNTNSGYRTVTATARLNLYIDGVLVHTSSTSNSKSGSDSSISVSVSGALSVMGSVASGAQRTIRVEWTGGSGIAPLLMVNDSESIT